MSYAPHMHAEISTTRVMGTVLAALLPAIAVYAWVFGPLILVQLTWATLLALLLEAAILCLRSKPVRPALTDLSAVVTAWLLVLTLPPTTPWWITAIGVVVAIGVAKHLYGGLGQNPFNPAMVAFATLIVAFPAALARWPTLETPLAWQWAWFLGQSPADAVVSATAFDVLRHELRTHGVLTPEVARSVFGVLSSAGYEYVALAFLAGGIFLLWRRIITWHLPVAFLGTLFLIATLAWWIDPSRFAPPQWHVFAYSSMLAAFFIITDPVSGVVTPRGKLLFGAGTALLAYLIRNFGQFPDGVAFAVLLMNITAPWLERKTLPPAFGQGASR